MQMCQNVDDCSTGETARHTIFSALGWWGIFRQKRSPGPLDMLPSVGALLSWVVTGIKAPAPQGLQTAPPQPHPHHPGTHPVPLQPQPPCQPLAQLWAPQARTCPIRGPHPGCRGEQCVGRPRGQPPNTWEPTLTPFLPTLGQGAVGSPQRGIC